jgi:hypothetical protein
MSVIPYAPVGLVAFTQNGVVLPQDVVGRGTERMTCPRTLLTGNYPYSFDRYDLGYRTAGSE